jgi:hypothetical protein
MIQNSDAKWTYHLANVNRGANHLAEGETTDSLATREKI